MKLVAWVVGYVVFLALAITACGSGGAPSDVVTLDGLTFPITDEPGGPYTLLGSVTHLKGNGLVLKNGNQTVAVNANTDPDEPNVFVFPNKLDAGSDFSITIEQQPTGPDQICTIGYGQGRAFATVRIPIVTCALPARFAYMLRSKDILKLDFNEDTGALTPGPSTSWEATSFTTSYYSLTKHPFQPYIFVFHAFERKLESFHVDDLTGNLKLQSTQHVNNEDGNAFRVRFSVDGEFVYVGGRKNGVYGFKFSAVDGTMTPINGDQNLISSSGAPGNVLLDDFVMDPSGEFMYASNDAQGIDVFRINKSTGLLSHVDHYASTHGVDMLSISNDGAHLFATYSATAADLDMEIIDIANGVLTHHDNVTISHDPDSTHKDFWSGISVDPTGKVVFINEKNAGDMGAYPIADLISNTANHIQYAVVTSVGNFARSFFSFSPDGKFVFSQHHEIGGIDATGMDGYRIDMTRTAGGFTKLVLPTEVKDALAFVIY